MSDFPIGLFTPLPCISPMSLESIAKPSKWSGLGAGSAVFPADNLALFVPFYVSVPVTVSKMYSYNGATASGNIDVGIYDVAGTKIVSKGSTAQSGTSASALQEYAVTATQFGPGTFYLAVAMDNHAGTLYRWNLTTMLTSVVGMAQMATAFPLPPTATFATCGYGYIPLIAACVGGPGFI